MNAEYCVSQGPPAVVPGRPHRLRPARHCGCSHRQVGWCGRRRPHVSRKHENGRVEPQKLDAQEAREDGCFDTDSLGWPPPHELASRFRASLRRLSAETPPLTTASPAKPATVITPALTPLAEANRAGGGSSRAPSNLMIVCAGSTRSTSRLLDRVDEFALRHVGPALDADGSGELDQLLLVVGLHVAVNGVPLDRAGGVLHSSL
jgi:hypothetical protein